MATSPLTASRYPQSTASPNVSQDIQNAVTDLEDNTIPYFATSGARDTAFTNWVAAGNSMRDGLYCHVQGTGLMTYRSGAWGTGVVADTGWTDFTPNTPLTVGALGASYRKVNGVVEFHMDSNYSGTYGTSFTVFTLPTGYRPGRALYVRASFYDGSSGPFKIDTSGAVQYTGANVSQPGVLVDATFLAA